VFKVAFGGLGLEPLSALAALVVAEIERFGFRLGENLGCSATSGKTRGL
jgi:hypothetical protein